MEKKPGSLSIRTSLLSHVPSEQRKNKESRQRGPEREAEDVWFASLGTHLNHVSQTALWSEWGPVSQTRVWMEVMDTTAKPGLYSSSLSPSSAQNLSLPKELQIQ